MLGIHISCIMYIIIYAYCLRIKRQRKSVKTNATGWCAGTMYTLYDRSIHIMLSLCIVVVEPNVFASDCMRICRYIIIMLMSRKRNKNPLPTVCVFRNGYWSP